MLGTGDCDWRRAHIVYYLKNGIIGGRQQIERPRGIALLLLFGAGS